MTRSGAAYDPGTLIESNAREAADLVGELTLLLDRVDKSDKTLAGARLVTRRIADRLGQIVWLRRVEAGGTQVESDAWSPVELIEELEEEAASLAGGRISVGREVPEVLPQYWFFDRDLAAATLRNALHSALVYARGRVTLGLAIRDGWLGFSVEDDGGAFPEHLLVPDAAAEEPERCNGNALGILFARVAADAHRNGARAGRVELANRTDGPGTRFVLWLP